MKTVTIIKMICLPAVMIFIITSASAQTDSAEVAAKWVKSGVWAAHTNIHVFKEVNAVQFYRQYQSAKKTWDKAFSFLADKAKLDTLKPGIYPIDGANAYASITFGPEKAPEAARWESHRKFIDLQYVIKGEEGIEMAPVTGAAITRPYDPVKDVANYSANGILYKATPEEFFLFFPTEAHKPNIHIDGYDMVKKLVIKIRYVE